ncbi:CynX/NimT family MFS transporter [Aneurinibacillus tyrosinisolvens]|uniref:CynX/NimT family MFS transporter n=1 Tax=Aneurinibacillus tyrosinisolvens TaxID=1443435 RepID=UPI00063ED9DD|nr:MFS transporter [Aneurinibacillus tyrosinisolvens]
MLSKGTITDKPTSARLGIWMLILGIIFAGANLRAPLTSVGPIIETIRQDTGMSHTLAGMLTTLPLLAFAFFSPLAPKIARRIGLEYTLFGALLLLAAGIILRSVPFINTLFIGTAVLGIAIAICNVLLPSLIKREFLNKVGIMTGIYAVSMNLWGAIASGISIPITQGIEFGWRVSLACWVLLSVVSIVLWIPQLRSQYHSKSSLDAKLSLWHSRLAWNVTLFMGLQSTVFYVVITWLPSILNQQGISQSEAGWLLSLTQFASLPSTFIVSVLAGRSSNQRGLVGFTVIFLLLGYIGLFSGITSLAPLYVILIGIAIGSAFGLATLFFVLRTHNAHQAAELSSMAQSVGYLVAAVGPALFGFIHDITNSWTIPLLILIVGALFLFIVGMEAGSSNYVTAPESTIKSNSLNGKA